MITALVEFFHALSKLRLHHQAMLVALVALLVLLPGQNGYQTLILHPQTQKVKALTVELPTFTQYPVFHGDPAPPLTAKSALVIDVDSAVVVYQKDPDRELMPASTTKIMTALVALDVYDLNQVLTVKEADESIGHSMHLVRGETMTVEGLLYGILVESGNDAALALAQGYPQGYQEFVNRMNSKAKELHATHTVFRNVSGVEQVGHVTTVRDLSIIARAAMQNPEFAKIVATKTVTIKSTDAKIVHQLENINELLGVVPGIKGIKTGWTEHAGECLVTLTEREVPTKTGNVTKSIITAILGSEDRFGESQSLIEWAFANHTWEAI